MAPGPESIDDAIDWLRNHFQPEPARGLRADFQLDLSGDRGGGIAVRVRDGCVELDREPLARPHVRLRIPAADYFGILAGRENADLLFMAGRLEIDGDLSLAMKLRSLFRHAA